jgi:endonuclease/exonuclease/phosphatase family metal-dependent hydrolase
LAVLSKYPILYSKFFSFGLGVFSDSSSDKGYIYCKIDVEGDTIHLFNLHLQASYLTSEKSSYHKELSLAARRHQVKLLKSEIKKLLHTHYRDKDLILLIGDFNINAHDEKECLSKSSLYKAFIP